MTSMRKRYVLPGEPNHQPFSGKQTWPAVKCWPTEIISTYIQEHNLGGQPCQFIAGKAQKAKIQDGRHQYLIHITF